MTYIISLFLFLASLSSAFSAVISGQTEQIIEMDTGFNGTDMTVFGTVPNRDIKSVSLEIFGPIRQFKTLNTESQKEEKISVPSFYAGNSADQIPSFDKVGHYLTSHNLLQKMPDITLQNNTLFWSKIFLPADAPVGKYTITYKVLDLSGKTHLHNAVFQIKAEGLQHLLYRLAVEYPFLNAILVIVSATFMSHTIRFAMRKS